jgi:hypothetical protein
VTVWPPDGATFETAGGWRAGVAAVDVEGGVRDSVPFGRPEHAASRLSAKTADSAVVLVIVKKKLHRSHNTTRDPQRVICLVRSGRVRIA